MGPPGGEVVGRIGLDVGEELRTISGVRHAPQHGVDQASCTFPSEVASVVHRLGHGGVLGHRSHVQELIRPQAQNLEHVRIQRVETTMDPLGQQVIDSSAQSRHAVCELVREGGFERAHGRVERHVEATPAFGLLPDSKRRQASGTRGCQSSIPVVGDDGTAISREGILPARNAKRPATMACLIAWDMRTGSSAAARAVFMSTPSTPCSMVTHGRLRRRSRGPPADA